MSKTCWEYVVYDITAGTGILPSDEELMHVLDNYGFDGWELVQIENNRCILKRPLPEQT